MAKTKTSKKTKKTKKKKQQKEASSIEELSNEKEVKQEFNPLPNKVWKPILNLTLATTLIHGPPKIGKTTLANQWPGVWFLATEIGQKWITTHEPTIIESWEHFLEVCAWIATNRPKKFGDGKPLKTLAVDTIDLAFKMCYETTCDEMGINSPADLDYGVGWAAISDEFSRVITKLTKLPYGLIFISHSKEKQIKSRSRKIDRIEPALMVTGLKVVSAISDIILYCNVKETVEVNDDGEPTGAVTERRVIRCQPESNIVAGDRTGCLPDEIDMSYKTLVKHFPQTK